MMLDPFCSRSQVETTDTEILKIVVLDYISFDLFASRPLDEQNGLKSFCGQSVVLVNE